MIMLLYHHDVIQILVITLTTLFAAIKFSTNLIWEHHFLLVSVTTKNLYLKNRESGTLYCVHMARRFR